jgi:hypothetical protein
MHLDRSACVWPRGLLLGGCVGRLSAYLTRGEFTARTSIRRGRFREFYTRVARTARRRAFGRTRFTDNTIIIIIYTAPNERELLLLRRRRYVCSKRRVALKVHEAVASAMVVASVKNIIPTTSAQGNGVRRSVVLMRLPCLALEILNYFVWCVENRRNDCNNGIINIGCRSARCSVL